MTRYNHFAKKKYAQIPFSMLKVGDKFRKDFGHSDNGYKRTKYRRDIVCIKKGDTSFMELRSKVYYQYNDAGFTVSHYSVKAGQEKSFEIKHISY